MPCHLPNNPLLGFRLTRPISKRKVARTRILFHRPFGKRDLSTWIRHDDPEGSSATQALKRNPISVWQ